MVVNKGLALIFSLFIAHDRTLVKYISDRVAVMCQGQLVELADVEELYCRPRHLYTQQLLSALPC
ncbi:MAG: hypothetical protein ACHQUC_09515 [Chlamydiales bacterium]